MSVLNRAAAADTLDAAIQTKKERDRHELIAIANLEFEGFNQKEIAEKLDIAPVTVARGQNLIRRIWRKEIQGSTDD